MTHIMGSKIRRRVSGMVLAIILLCGIAQAADFTKPYDPDAFHQYLDRVRTHFSAVEIEERTIGDGRIPVCITYERAIYDLKKPALIWLTGWGGGRGAIGDIVTFAREGYLVVTVDPPGVGARWDPEFRDLVDANQPKAFFTAMRTTARDVSEVVDYLLTRDDVIPDKIGLGGGSFGGFTTIVAATMEKRIAAFVPVVGSCNVIDFFERSVVFTSKVPIDVSMEAEIKEIDAFYHPERLYPSAIRFVQNTTDLVVPPDNSKRLYEKALPFYKGKADLLSYEEFADEESRVDPGVAPTPVQIAASHKVTHEMWVSILEWLAKHLKGEDKLATLIPMGRKQPFLYDEPEIGNIGWIRATYAQFLKDHPEILVKEVFVDNQIPILLIQDRKFEGIRKATIISLHGWGGNKMRTAWGTKTFTDRGYLVVAVDAYGKGNRWTPAFARLLEEGSHKALFRAVFQTAKDMPKVVDYLLEHDDVDPDRIGLVGGSMGGAETIFTAATEKRIKAYVAVAAPFNFSRRIEEWRSMEGTSGSGTNEAFLKEIQKAEALAAPEKFYPTALLFVHNKNDAVVPPDGAHSLYERIAPFYKDHPERLQWKAIDHTALPTDREPTDRDRWATHTEGGDEGKTAIFEWFERYVRGTAATEIP